MTESTRLVAGVALAAVLVAACGDDSGPALDAGPADAAACALPIDLDAVMRENGAFLYSGSVAIGGGELAPQTGCAAGGTLNESAHRLTLATRSRLLVLAQPVQGGVVAPILYVRSSCDGSASELACNANAEIVDLADVPAGEVFFIVDAPAGTTLPLGYDLAWLPTPLRGTGETCDPTGATDLCETGTVCASSGGAPACAPSLGGPTLERVSFRFGDFGQNPATIGVQGTDPDGDVLEARMTFLGAMLNPLDLDGDTTPDELTLRNIAIPGQLAFDEQFIADLPENLSPTIFFVSVKLVDSADNESAAVVAGLIREPDFNGPGGACNSGDDFCTGEVSCVATTCTSPAGATAACAAADSAPAVTVPGSHQVTLPMSAADNLEGSCFFNPGLGEAVVRVTVTGASPVRFEARSDVAPSGMFLDTYLYLRSSCADPTSELACNDDVDPFADNFRSAFVVDNLAPGTYYLVVDGSSDGGTLVGSGNVGLSLTATALVSPGAPCAGPTDACVPDSVCAGGTCVATASACAAATPVLVGTPVIGQLGATGVGLFDACGFETNRPEQLHTLTLTAEADVTLSTDGNGTEVDTAVYVLPSCGAPYAALACNDDIVVGTTGRNWRSSLFVTLPAGTYTVVVDRSSNFLPDGSADAADPADYSLSATTRPVLPAAATCDTTGVANRCADGLSCTAGTCQ